MDTKSLARWLCILLALLGLLFALVGLADSLNESKKETEKVRIERDKIEQNLKQLEDKYHKLKISKKAKSSATQVAAMQPKPPQQPAVHFSIPPDKENIASEIRQSFGNEFAVKVAVCESGLNPYAVGSHGERGIFQIHPVHISSLNQHGYTWDQMFDPNANIAYARLLYGWQGWGPWSCSKKV